jgi:heat shock protein HslJ
MRKFSLSVVRLVLLGGCTTVTDNRPELVGSEWIFTAIDGAPPLGGATLSFQADRLSANAGCNRMAGDWRSKGGQLIAGPLMATKMFCEGRMEQERAVSELLEARPELTVSGDRMTLASSGHSAELQRK